MGYIEMLRSVEDTAKELKVSKTAIYNKLKLKEFKDLVVKKQGRSMVDDTLFNFIKDSLKLKEIVENEDGNSTEEAAISMDEDGLFNLNKELINNLLEQLREKDKQVAELHKLIENSQVLLKEEQKKTDNQLYLADHFEEVDSKLQDLKDKLEQKRSNKGNLFTRLLLRSR